MITLVKIVYIYIEFSKYEEIILNTINFDIKVYHVFTPLASLFHYMPREKFSQDFIDKMHKEAQELARKTFYDYMIFLIPHGIISIAVFTIILDKHSLRIDDLDFPNISDIIKKKKDDINKAIEEIKSYETRIFGKEDAQKAIHKFAIYKMAEEFVKPSDRLPPPVKKEKVELPSQ